MRGWRRCWRALGTNKLGVITDQTVLDCMTFLFDWSLIFESNSVWHELLEMLTENAAASISNTSHCGKGTVRLTCVLGAAVQDLTFDSSITPFDVSTF
jgi:hypothetical protein